MSFDNRDKARRYKPQDGDTLEDIAARERAGGRELTLQQLARFNWGTDDPDQINELMRDELGCRKRDDAGNFVIADDDRPRNPLLIPEPFARQGLPVDREHTLRVRRKACPPQFLECCSIPGITFEFDKSFIRPSVVGALKELEEAVGRHPDARVMIFGHTDKVGSDAYNKSLSERRAKSVFAFITNDVEAWEQLCSQEGWGTNETDQMLADQGFDRGTRPDAVREYQTSRGLTVDGSVGPQTRAQLFSDYMSGKHDLALTPDQFMEPRHMGCGEFNPQVATDAAEERNRRVTFFLFHRERLPNLPCAAGDLAPCQRQMTPAAPRFKSSFRCSFFDSIAAKCPCEGGDTRQGRVWIGLQPLFEDELPEEATIRIEASTGDAIEELIERGTDHGDGLLYFALPNPLDGVEYRVTLRSRGQEPRVLFEGCQLSEFVRCLNSPSEVPTYPDVTHDAVQHDDEEPYEDGDSTSDPYELDELEFGPIYG